MVQSPVRKVTPKSVAFEIVSPDAILRVSEVLTDFEVRTERNCAYRGKAVVANLLSAGAATICEAGLSGSLVPGDPGGYSMTAQDWERRFHSFVTSWQKYHHMAPEFRLAVAELQSFLRALRLWVDQVELRISALKPAERGEKEKEFLERLPARATLDALVERFEAAAKSVPEDLAAVHRDFCRQLHDPLLLSPFNYRIYAKPLGYAGDYEMIDMIVRNRYEGNSIFAKLVHAYILDQAPAHSVRHRASFFTSKLLEETARVRVLGRNARFLSLGCGPACEVQRFLAEHPLSDCAEFDLLDFNEETLAYTRQALTGIISRCQRRPTFRMIKKSVFALLKEPEVPETTEPSYDMIYCSGLYDYLNDRVCKALNAYLYERLQPGGVLITTNFDPSNPIRNLQEYVFEWFLLYRTASRVAALSPAGPANSRIISDPTGCNLFLEVRKTGR